MKARLLTFWAGLADSFWLVPTVMAVLAMAVAVGMVALDRRLNLDVTGVAWVWSGGADGARSLLSTVATSMMTVAGTVFSITIAALTLASQQFGPRLLRNFTADRGNQIVLGTFVATFLYCLMVLRTVRSHDEGHFVPNVAVSFGVVLACASLGVLIYFIHHVSGSIQAESLAASVARDLKSDLERLSPPTPPGPGAAPHAAPPDRPAEDVLAVESGYIQAIDRDGLVATAEERGLLVKLQHRPGDYVSEGEPILCAWTESDALAPEEVDRLRGSVHLGQRRTPLQDARYGVRQLTEIGARALSPGINDPFTAMGCVDWLTDALEGVARREAPSGVRRSQDGTPRLIEEPVVFADLLALSFDPIRAYGASSVIVAVHLLESLARLASRVTRPDQRQAVLREAQMTLRAAQEALRTEQDRERVARAFASVRERLGPAPPSSAGEISASPRVRAHDSPADVV